MPQYLSPGVYVEEVPSTIKPIAGVSTSTAAFVGIVPNAGVDIPEENPDFDPSKPEIAPNLKENPDFDSTRPDAPDNPKANPKFNPKLPETAGSNQKFRTWKFPFPQPAYDEAKKNFADASQENVRPAMPKKDVSQKDFRDKREAFALAARRLAASDFAPEGKPMLCTSFAEFRQQFGDFSTNPDQNRLVHGVFGFFNNGGSRCFVMRYADLNGLKAPTALTPLEAIDEISMVVAPGIADPVVQENLIDHCENLHDRVAILDAPWKDVGDMTVDKIKVMNNTDYGSVYFPRIKVFDTVTALTQVKSDDLADLDEGEIFVAPSGHMAGIYARVDHTRGVHKAPANEPVHGALGLEHQISKALQDGLNPDGINCIRNINGKITVWGARTIGGDINADLKYISTRRLLIFIEKSIDHGTQWVVFEPNDRSLWAKIERNVGAFLTTVWRDGALFGSTPQEAFYVRCDDETNPPDERDLGKVTTEIGVAITKPAEFVIFRVQQWAGPAPQ